jgi:26S proteasome regulatory subunit N8
MMLVIYVASLIRSVTALHDLINNKLDLASFESGEKKDKDQNGEKKDQKDAKEKKEEKKEDIKKSDGDKSKK